MGERIALPLHLSGFGVVCETETRRSVRGWNQGIYTCSEDWYPLVLQTAYPHRSLSYTHTYMMPREISTVLVMRLLRKRFI
jgi:hypothetical protein